jgi:anthranilate phosphoribosyltransferase
MHHPAMRHAVAVRKSLGVPTVFNILGPLSNPAGAQAALIGSSNLTLAPVMAQALADRGVRALVVRGDDGLDEISIAAATVIWDATSGNVIERRIDVRDLGIAHHPIELLIGGEADVNAALLRQALGMADVEDASRIDAIRDAVLVNAAGGLVAYDIACGAEPIRDDVDFIARMHAGVERARTALLSGAAGGLLQRWSAVTKELAS